MQEWMIAMLVISIMLIIRDMAKTILSNRRSREGGEVCGIFSETGRYFLRDALSERLSEQQAG